MTVLSLLACAVLVWAWLTRRCGSVLVARIERIAPGAAPARACALALVPLYAAQLALLALQNRYQNVYPLRAWLKALPIPVFYSRTDREPFHALFGGAGIALGIAETLALATIVLALRQRPKSLPVFLIAALTAGCAFLSLAAPVMATGDPYEYAAAGILGFHAYAPPPHAFAGTAYAPYAQHIPLRGVIYGPLWLLIDVAETRLAPTVYAKIEALRLANAALVMAFLWLLARAQVSRTALVAGALNPAIWYQGVANPHAEITALALLSAAYTCARSAKSVWAGAFLVAAGLIKVPFVLIGGALLAPLAGVKRRGITWLAAVTLVLAVSYVAPGHAYVHDLTNWAGRRVRSNWTQDWLAILPVAIAATAVLLAVRRGFFGMAWLFHQMAPAAAPWYLFWGVPYALGSGSLTLFLVAFPFAATQTQLQVFDSRIRMAPIGAAAQLFLLATVVGLTIDVLQSRRRQRLSARVA